MRITLSRLGLLLGAGAVAVLGFAGTASAAPTKPVDPSTADSSTTSLLAPGTTSKAATQRTDYATQANLNGGCEAFEFCLYPLNGNQGSVADFLNDDANYFNDSFVGQGDGRGLLVANAARSAINADPYFFVIGCIEVNFSGMCGAAAPLTAGDLFPDYFLNLESHYFA